MRTLTDVKLTDPGLLQKHSSFKSYTTPYGRYPSIRIFYRPHPQAPKLPSKPAPLPLLVFIHGLGGCLAQFAPILTSLVNVGPCLGIDLPGCGRSEFSPQSWPAYTTQALTQLLSVVIKEHLEERQGAVLIAHSMGCSFSVLLASEERYALDILAMVGICPQGTKPSAKQVSTYKRLLLVPTPVFDLWRAWDRWGGPESPSVARFVGHNADIEVKRLQQRFNTQSKTGVWRRMASGALPTHLDPGQNLNGIPGLDTWARLKVPIFLVGGEADAVTKVDQIQQIGRALGKMDKARDSTASKATSSVSETQRSEGATKHIDQRTNATEGESKTSATETTLFGDDETTKYDRSAGPPSSTRRRQVLKTSILPSPAGHALLYDPATSR